MDLPSPPAALPVSPSRLRRLLGLTHRWAGLATAAFLFLAGLTGAVIAFDHEVDGWLSPAFYVAESAEPARDPLDLADALEASNPALRVVYLPLSVRPGAALSVWVAPREGADPLGFDQVALDPGTGRRQAARQWGAAALDRTALVPFLYELHHSLHLPGTLGTLLMGAVAVVWTLDCFVALALSFPSRALWRRSFQVSWRTGGRRLLFDLHRSGGVWLWIPLLVLAITAVSMNLEREVVRPLVGAVSTLRPDPWTRAAPEGQDGDPLLPRREAVAAARSEADRRGWGAPAGGLFDVADRGTYAVGFFEPGMDHGDGGLGNPWLFIDRRTGAVVDALVPGEGSAGDLFLQAQFPLHSGRIAGGPGRALVALLGLAIAGLSATGVALWARRRLVALRRRRMEAAHGA